MHLSSRSALAMMAALLLAPITLSASSAIAETEYRPEPDAITAFESAQEYRKLKDWRSARVELMNAVKADQRWAAPRLALAETALRLFDPVLALEQLEQLKALGADEREYAHMLAHAQWMIGEPAKAVATLKSMSIADRNLPYAYRVLGRAQIDLGDTVAASEAFDQGLKLAPKDSLLWTEIGRLRMVISNQAGAIEALDRAVALDPANVRALELRGRLVRDQFGMVAALPWFERGLSIDPNDIPLLEEYGATLGETGRYRDMLAQARKIWQLDTRNQRAVFMQATIAARAKQFALARRLLEKVDGGYGELPGPKLLRAVCEYELGNPNKAIDILAPLLATQPNNESIRLVLGRAMHRSGDQDGALQMVAPVASRSDSGVYAQRLLARILEARDVRDEAAIYLDRAAYPSAQSGLALNPLGPPVAIANEASDNPGDARKVIPNIRALLSQGNIDGARASASRLLAGNDGVADAQILKGDIEWLAGNVPGAVAAYEKARTLRFSRPLISRLANAYRAAGNQRAASEAIAAYVAYNPADIVGLRLWAFDLMDRKQWQQALPALLQLRARTGMNDSALNANIARTLSELGRHDEAIRLARLAYRIDPASIMTTRAYGNVLVKAGKKASTAQALLRKATKLAPADIRIAREYRAALSMKSGA